MNIITIFSDNSVILQAQNVLVVIIVGAIIDFLIGAIVGPTDDLRKTQGFLGFNGN